MEAQSRVLFVAWQDPVTRRILPVARVSRESQGYEFAYIQAVREAMALGFLPLLSFPELTRVYRSRQMLPLLHNRLMQSNRPDYDDYLEQLGLAADSAEPFSVLGRSGGRRTTDTLELFSPPTLGEDGRMRSVVLARGVRHLPEAEAVIAQLCAGTQLQVRAEPGNAVNAKALQLVVAGAGPVMAVAPDPAGAGPVVGTVIGYLPDYLVTELACDASQVEVRVRRVNLPPAPVQHRLLLDVAFPSSEPPPFSGERYVPLSDQASSHAA
jgi:hypothetical protein